MSATKNVHTNNEAETEQLGESLGRNLKGGEIIELVSDLGGGKTAFTRGLVRGAGSADIVGSPTFALSKIYKSQSFDIHHFDFYRLSEAGIMEHELRDVLADPQAVVVIEWGDVVQHVLPKKRLTIQLSTPAEDNRILHYSYPDDLKYLVESTLKL